MKKVFMLLLILVILFVSVVSVPRQQVVQANPAVKLVDKATKTIVNRFGYKMTSNKTAQEVSEILIKKMKKDGTYTEYMASLDKVANVEGKIGWAKWIVPAGTIASVAGVLHGLLQESGGTTEVEEEVPMSDLVTGGNPENIEITEGVDGEPFTYRLQGVTFPIQFDFAPTKNVAGFNYKYEPEGFYNFSYIYSPSEFDVPRVRAGSYDSHYMYKLVFEEVQENSGFKYRVNVFYENTSGSGSDRHTDFFSASQLQQYFLNNGMFDTSVVPVPEFETFTDREVINPDNLPEGDMEIIIPNEYGMEKYFNNDEEIYLNTIQENPEIMQPDENEYIQYEPSYIPNPSYNPEVAPSVDNPNYIPNPNYDPNKMVPTGLTDITRLPDFDPITGTRPNPDPNGGSGEGGNGKNPEEELDLDPLKKIGHTFTNKFPFSLHWDIKRGIESLSGNKNPPEFEIVLPSPSGEVRYTFGLPEEIEKFMPFIRGSFVAVFLLSLIWGTRRLMGGGV